MQGADHETQPPDEISGRQGGLVSPDGLAKTRHRRLELLAHHLVGEGLALCEESSQQARRKRTGFRGGEKQWPGKRIENFWQGHRAAAGVGLGGFEQVESCLVDLAQPKLQQVAVEALFIVEVIIDGGHVDPGY